MNGSNLWSPDYTTNDLQWLAKLSDEEVISLFLPLIQDLSELHNPGIIHCDIAPNNILYDEQNGRATLHLVDFGSAVFCEQEQSFQPIAAKPKYSAPEMTICPNRCEPTPLRT